MALTLEKNDKNPKQKPKKEESLVGEILDNVIDVLNDVGDTVGDVVDGIGDVLDAIGDIFD